MYSVMTRAIVLILPVVILLLVAWRRSDPGGRDSEAVQGLS